jgi:hypothetical protein
VIAALPEKQHGVSNKPARYYVFNRNLFENGQMGFVNLKMEGSFTLFN